MSEKTLKNTLKTLTLSFLIVSSGAFAMKKADFIKCLNEQIATLEVERDEIIGSGVASTEYIILALDAQIAGLEAEKASSDL